MQATGGPSAAVSAYQAVLESTACASVLQRLSSAVSTLETPSCAQWAGHLMSGKKRRPPRASRPMAPRIISSSSTTSSSVAASAPGSSGLTCAGSGVSITYALAVFQARAPLRSIVPANVGNIMSTAGRLLAAHHDEGDVAAPRLQHERYLDGDGAAIRVPAQQIRTVGLHPHHVLCTSIDVTLCSMRNCHDAGISYATGLGSCRKALPWQMAVFHVALC